MAAVQNDMPHHGGGCRRKKTFVIALTKYSGGDMAGGYKEGVLCYRLQMSPKLHLIWGWVESSGLFREQFRGFT